MRFAGGSESERSESAHASARRPEDGIPLVGGGRAPPASPAIFEPSDDADVARLPDQMGSPPSRVMVPLLLDRIAKKPAGGGEKNCLPPAITSPSAETPIT